MNSHTTQQASERNSQLSVISSKTLKRIYTDAQKAPQELDCQTVKNSSNSNKFNIFRSILHYKAAHKKDKNIKTLLKIGFEEEEHLDSYSMSEESDSSSECSFQEFDLNDRSPGNRILITGQNSPSFLIHHDGLDSEEFQSFDNFGETADTQNFEFFEKKSQVHHALAGTELEAKLRKIEIKEELGSLFVNRDGSNVKEGQSSKNHGVYYRRRSSTIF